MAWLRRLLRGVIAVVVVASAAAVCAQESGPARPRERRLDAALAELQQQGLRIIYSSDVVRSHMRVGDLPRGLSLRRQLDVVLAEHGLIAQKGPRGSLIVVRNPRARVTRPARAARPPSTGTLATGDTLEPPRYEEQIHVTDVSPAGSGVGPPAARIGVEEGRALGGAFDNVLRALQSWPGVTATDELGGRLAVRGGGPDQNLVVMDGIEVHHPFRLLVPGEDLATLGLGTLFNADSVESVALVPGAFDVRHGDRLSSLLLIEHRAGSEAARFQGTSSIGLAEASVLVEGRLPGGAPGSWLVNARRSYFDLVAKHVVDTSLPSAQDVHLRASWQVRPGQRVSLVGLAGQERLRPSDAASADASFTTRTRNVLGGLTFDTRVGANGALRMVASLSQFTDTLEAVERSLDNSRGANTPESIAEGGLLDYRLGRAVAIRDLALRQELAVQLSPAHGLDVGAEAHAMDTRWAWRISGDRSPQQANGSSVRLGASLPDVLDSGVGSHRIGAWVQDRWQVSSRLALQPGLRVDYSTLTAETTLSPRLSATWAHTGGWRIDGAMRLHAQTPGYEKLLQGDYFVDLSAPEGRHLRAERAWHTVAGVERTFAAGFTGRVDVYYKRSRDLLVGRLETESERLARLASYDVPTSLWSSVPRHAQITTTPANAAAGTAYGLEALLARRGRRAGTRFTGWASYSFGRADQTAYGVTRPFDYDRRHALTAAATVRLGPRMDLAVTGRWASGLPRTPVRGVRLVLVPDAEDADADGNHDEPVPQRDAGGHPFFEPDLGDVTNINSARLPRFARIDARLTYRPAWTGERWAFHLDLVNVLNMTNILQIDAPLVFDPASDRPRIVERAQDRGLPFFPSFGIRVWF